MSIPVYIKETTNDMISNVVVDSGYALLFYQDEKLKLKLPNGNVIDATGSNNSDVNNQLVSFQDINNLVNGNIVITSEGFPVWLRTDKGNFYPVEKESLIYSDGCYQIKPSPYLVYDNASEFSGTWRVYFACGIQGDGLISNSTFPIGTIFPSISKTPPAGSYLLNGQTIFKCNEIYKQFYNWVNNSGTRIVDNETYEQELNETGVCGAFVVDSENGNIRLPSITKGTLWGADNTTIGQSLAAGLPNIDGSWQAVHGKYVGGESYFDPQGAIEYIASETAHNGVEVRGTPSGDGASDRLGFNASSSNSIYGNSDTVQPTSVCVSWCIQVFNSATELSEQESVQLASQMQLKANKELTNVNDNIDFIVEHGEGTGEDGSVVAWWWYDKYRSGKVVQGGKTALQTKVGQYTINLPVEMDSADYIIFLTYDGESGALTSGGTYDATTASNITATGFDTYLRITNNTKYKFWRVEGKAATE